jgi:hypothetical protein
VIRVLHVKFHQIPKLPKAPRIQIESNLAQIGSLIFNSNSSLNFEKLQWGNLFLIQFPTRPYFI